MMSVAMSPDGWTTVAPAPDTHVVYVSSSTGNDQNGGFSPSDPVASISKGVSLLRDGSADWLLLKCGDTWNSGLGVWRKSGRSNDEPMLIGSYGVGARPLLDTGTDSGFWAASISNQQIDHIAIIGLHFNANGRDPNSPAFSSPTDATGIDVLTRTDGLTIEDCQVENYAVNINVQSFYGPISNVSIRRNVIDDAYATTTHSQGLYCYGVNNLLIDQNVFNANGFNTQVPGAGPTYYNHDCYLSSNNTSVTVRENIIANAAGYGLQARSGGIVEDNVFINDPVGMSFGLVNGSHTTPGGVTGIVNGNVFTGGGNLNGSPYGQGLVLGNTEIGYPTIVSNNIFLDSLARAPAAITLTYGFAQIDPQKSAGLNDLNIEHNIIYNWFRGVYVDSGFQYGGKGLRALNNVNVRYNDFQNIAGPDVQSQAAVDTSQLHFTGNTYDPGTPYDAVSGKAISYDSWRRNDESDARQMTVPYIDAARSLAGYDAAAGGAGTIADYLANEMLQSRQTWQGAYDVTSLLWYLRGGFDVAAAPHNWAAPTPPIVGAIVLPATVMAKDTSITFTVTYLGDDAINLSSLSGGNLTATVGRFKMPAQYVSAISNGNQVTATYTLAAPGKMFRLGQPRKFKVSLLANQVTDAEGFPAQAGLLGTFKVHVIRRPRQPRAAKR